MKCEIKTWARSGALKILFFKINDRIMNNKKFEKVIGFEVPPEYKTTNFVGYLRLFTNPFIMRVRIITFFEILM